MAAVCDQMIMLILSSARQPMGDASASDSSLTARSGWSSGSMMPPLWFFVITSVVKFGIKN